MVNGEPEYLYHYTSIETLDFIVKYRTIRFSRLDQVDDHSEGLSFELLSLEKYFDTVTRILKGLTKATVIRSRLTGTLRNRNL